MLNKKGQQWLGPVLILLVVFGMYKLGFFGAIVGGTTGVPSPAPTGPTGTAPPTPTSTCAQPASITMTFGPQENFFNGTKITSQNMSFVLDGVYQGERTDGSTSTVAYQQHWIVYTGTGSSSPYYSYKEEGDVPCGAFSVGSQAVKYGHAGTKLVFHDNAPTFTIINDLNGQPNNNQTSENISTAGTGGGTLNMQILADKGFAPGDIGDNSDKQAAFVIVFDMNKTIYDTSKVPLDVPSGWTITPTSAPIIWDATSGSDSQGVAYKVTITDSPPQTNWFKKFHWRVTAQSGQNPADPSADVNVTLFPFTWCRDAATGQFIYAVQDSRNNLCGQTPVSFNWNVN